MVKVSGNFDRMRIVSFHQSRDGWLWSIITKHRLGREDMISWDSGNWVSSDRQEILTFWHPRITLLHCTLSLSSSVIHHRTWSSRLIQHSSDQRLGWSNKLLSRRWWGGEAMVWGGGDVRWQVLWHRLSLPGRWTRPHVLHSLHLIRVWQCLIYHFFSFI